MTAEVTKERENCEGCESLVDVFGNYVQCIRTGRLVDYEYWHSILPQDCPMRGVQND